jgi:hypothetical protein
MFYCFIILNICVKSFTLGVFVLELQNWLEFFYESQSERKIILSNQFSNLLPNFISNISTSLVIGPKSCLENN